MANATEMQQPIDRTLLSPRSQRLLAARDDLLRTLDHLDEAEAMVVLTIAAASWCAQTASTTRRTEIEIAMQFSPGIVKTLLNPDELVVPVRRQ